MQSYMALFGALGLTLCIITTSKNIQIIRHARQCLDVTGCQSYQEASKEGDSEAGSVIHGEMRHSGGEKFLRELL